MLIKEYRIPLPLTVQEYRIAQLYMIAKKSREESNGADSRIQILVNEPYFDGPGGSGQFTHKVYHIGSHLPLWFKSFLPKTALLVEEEAWNSYPYTKTRFTCPFVEKFSLEIETKYTSDGGTLENVFDLNETQLSNRIVDLIDVVKDQIGTCYTDPHAEDPGLYKSVKTGRGPLSDNWIEEYSSKALNKNVSQDAIMCAYKLCKVEFRYWGMQSKIERFIHDVALRNTMLSAHLQAWLWQDEWFGLTMEDIRIIERETAEMLDRKMNDFNQQQVSETLDEDETLVLNKFPIKPACSIEDVDVRTTFNSIEYSEHEVVPVIHHHTSESVKNQTSFSSSLKRSQSLQCLEITSDEEFFDCISMSDDQECFSLDSIESEPSIVVKKFQSLKGPSHVNSCSTSCLVFIFHGGSVLNLECEASVRNSDITTFEGLVESVARMQYPSLVGRVVVKCIACPSICEESLKVLSSINPYSFDVAENGLQDGCSTLAVSNEHLPVGSIPILAVSSSHYDNDVALVIHRANDAYAEFLKTPEGNGFTGHVVIIGDGMGSILAYDALTTNFLEEKSIGSETSESQFQPAPLTDLHCSTSNNVDCNKHFFGDNLRSSSESKSTDFRHASSGSSSLTKAESRAVSGQFDFEVGDLFVFGSPLAIVLAFRRIKSHMNLSNIAKPPDITHQMYNLFHPTDPLASRIEPLLFPTFSSIPPASIPRFKRNFKHSASSECYNQILDDIYLYDAVYHSSHESLLSQGFEDVGWGFKRRIDYAIYCPGGLTNFPPNSLPHLFHSSYWESVDVISFLLSQIIHKCNSTIEDKPEKYLLALKHGQGPHREEKWLRKITQFKIKNGAPNHRASDVIVGGDSIAQTLTGRFSYGRLDVALLTGERVDIELMKEFPHAMQWTKIATKVTDNRGRVTLTLPPEHKMSYGIYPVRMVVWGDKSSLHMYMAVLPPHTEAVVFSIDGSFTASVSVTGSDPRVRAGAVDVVRYWQDLGYVIIYVTARPDIQLRRVISWLTQHNFPHGLVWFTDGISTDPLRHKAKFLKGLVSKHNVCFQAAYGSAKDISLYTAIGLTPQKVYVIGKVSKKQQDLATVLSKGYADHLTDLNMCGRSRPAQGNGRMVIPKLNFGPPGFPLDRRRTLRGKKSSLNI